MKLIGVNKVQREIIFSGNREEAEKYIGEADSLLTDLTERLRKSPADIWMDSIIKEIPGGFIQCATVLHLTTREPIIQYINISVDSKDKKKVKKKEPYCFANRTIALATIINVNGVIDVSDNVSIICEEESVCDTCIDPVTYPEDYYCTKGITYNLEVCAGDDIYYMYENIPSTDFSPHCPGDVVFVVLHLSDEIPTEILNNALDSACSETQLFSKQFHLLGLINFSILPFNTTIPLHEYKLINN